MRGRWRLLLSCGLLGSWAVPVSIASGSETVTYSYDARGRLVQVSHSGSVNNGVQANYSYDRADNRTNVTVAGTGGPAAYPSFSVNDAAVTEGSALVFTVTKSGSATLSYSVSYATSAGSAAAGSDYTATSGTLNFASNEATKTISVSTSDDAAVESSETLSLLLSAATGGSTISDAQGVGTINDNDVLPPSFAVNDVSATEGGALTFTVTRSGTTTGSYTINYATSNGTAAAGSDYTTASAALTFAAGEMTKTIVIATINDTAVESTEAFNLTLSGATGGAIISDAQGIGTINDNDVLPASFAVNDATADEGSAVSFTITRTGPTSTSQNISYATSNGTAVSGSDYGPSSGTATFAPGQTSQIINVPALSDQLSEGAETFTLNLSGATGGAVIGDGQGVGTIYNVEPEPEPEVCYDEGGSPTPCL